MKTLIVGANGQLGQELQRLRPAHIECLATDRAQLDISCKAAVMDFLQENRPGVILNCAAYTAVDGAELKPDLAVEINAEAVGNLAQAAQLIGARVIHVSTDFVFDGSAVTPYEPGAETRPLGMYGHSKLAGENRLQEVLPLDSVIIRTAWLYSRYGNNFVKTMLRLMNERTELGVVCDQLGAPTWAHGLAGAVWGMLDFPQAHGIYHWTDNGCCSWHEFACAIYAEGRVLGLVNQEVALKAITTQDYPTPAVRPPYSVLNCEKIHDLLQQPGTGWREQLNNMLKEMTEK